MCDETAASADSTGRRLLNCADVECLDEYTLRCRLCSAYDFNLFVDESDLIEHVFRRHSELLRRAVADDLAFEAAVVCAVRVQRAIGSDAAPQLAFSAPDAVACPDCRAPVRLRRAHSPSALVDHLRSDGCVGRASMRSSMRRPRRKADAADVGGASERACKRRRTDYARDDAASLSPSSSDGSLFDRLSRMTCVPAQRGCPTPKRLSRVEQARTRMQVVFAVHNYMRHHRVLVPPIFLQRNLAYRRYSAGSCEKRSLSTAVKSLNRKSANTKEKAAQCETLELRFHRLVHKDLPGQQNSAIIDVSLVQLSSNKRKFLRQTKVGRTTVSVNRQASSSILSLALPPSFTSNGAGDSAYLYFVASVVVKESGIRQGERVIRSVPQRRAQLASPEHRRSSSQREDAAAVVGATRLQLVGVLPLHVVAPKCHTVALLPPDRAGVHVDDALSSDAIRNIDRTRKTKAEWPFVKVDLEFSESPSEESSANGSLGAAAGVLSEEPWLEPAQRLPPSLLYRPIYTLEDGDGIGHTTEADRPSQCPFCGVQRLRSVNELLTHLRSVHCRFTYKFTRAVGEGLLSTIDFSCNADFDGSNEVFSSSGGGGTVKRLTSTTVLVWRPAMRAVRRVSAPTTSSQLCDEQLKLDAAVALPPTGHTKQYFESRVRTQLSAADLSAAADDGADYAWLAQKAARDLQDFVDLNADEQRTLTNWSVFVSRALCVSSSDLGSVVRRYLGDNRQQLVSGRLKRNLVLHLVHLYNANSMTKPDFLQLSSVIQSFCRER